MMSGKRFYFVGDYRCHIPIIYAYVRTYLVIKMLVGGHVTKTVNFIFLSLSIVELLAFQPHPS